ncbi:MAG: hypothetical protein NXH90_16425 [Flavobacteriaceae bacterium]|nr:hypothetical protein [Flavobacteriaceae bacterium]
MKKRKVLQQYKKRALQHLDKIRGGRDDGGIDRDRVKRQRK